MSARSQRGRPVQRKQSANSMRLFYMILGAIAIAAIAIFAIVQIRRPATVTSVSVDSFPSKGKADAPVTLLEYADFQCPGCAAFATTLEPRITKEYIDTGKVRFIYHEFPLQQHSNAVPAAEAARCAGDQGKFWEMHDLLFANQAQWEARSRPLTSFLVYADELKLDRGVFEQCMSSTKYRATVQAAGQEAIKANIQQTPTFVINGKQYTSRDVEAGIKEALAAAGVK